MDKKFKIHLQAFSGGLGQQAINFKAIKSKLDWIFSNFTASSLIIGWHQNNQLYRDLKSYMHGMGAKIYLWFPVFSELGYFRTFHPVLDHKGMEISNNKLKEGENFDFYCPTNNLNIANIKGIYEEYYSGVGFDGIFLDKIRYPSFSNGPEGIYSCFCQECQVAMNEYGLDTSGILRLIEAVSTGEKQAGNQALKTIKGYNNFTYQFEEQLWQSFFEFKSYNISRSIKELSHSFKEAGLEVGLDTFAPFLGYFVGQDLRQLAGYCDFIKPMFYRNTWAPAGLPFESHLLYKAFNMNSIGSELNISKTSASTNWLFPGELVTEEVRALSNLGSRAAIIPGFEVNRYNEIAPIEPAYVAENLELFFQSGVEGVILSWDIMHAPEENLAIVKQFLDN